MPLSFEDKKSIRSVAIQNVIANLSVSPNYTMVLDTPLNYEVEETICNRKLLVGFIVAVDKGTFKDWPQYRYELGRVAENFLKGRSVPIHKPRGPGGKKEMVKLFNEQQREKSGVVYATILNLSGLRPLEKVKKILAADIKPQIKADLLSAVF
jgi:hypothetical protein